MAKKRNRNANGSVTQISVRPPPLKSSAIESEVAVPVLWSGLLAMSFGVAAILATLVLEAILAISWPWWLPLAVGGCVAVGILAWRLTVCERDRRELLLWPIESALGLDLDADGFIGAPEPEAVQEHKLVYVHNAERAIEQRDSGDFRRFLKGVYNDRGAAWRSWENTRLPSGRVVTQPLWEGWCTRLLSAGLAVRQHPTATLALTSSYREALETCRELL